MSPGKVVCISQIHLEYTKNNPVLQTLPSIATRILCHGYILFICFVQYASLSASVDLNMFSLRIILLRYADQYFMEPTQVQTQLSKCRNFMTSSGWNQNAPPPDASIAAFRPTKSFGVNANNTQCHRNSKITTTLNRIKRTSPLALKEES